MNLHKSDFISELSWRGFIYQSSAEQELDNQLASKKISGYIGFDCTAPSLHVGSLLQLLKLHWLQKCGHNPIILIGGGTSMLGDPSFKDESRKLLSVEDIEKNKDGIKSVISQFIDFKGQNAAIMVDNADWLLKLNYVDFLREVGQHYSINRMLTQESIKMRLERSSHLTFLEFNYMVFQGYDFVELYRRYGCTLQMGGSDQWGNIISGVELGRRLERQELFGLTSPLVTTSSGKKMGKTENGAVWLSKDMTSSFDFWQYWRNTDDNDVVRYLRLYTLLAQDEIKIFENVTGAELNEAKILLANKVTEFVHGKKAADEAALSATGAMKPEGFINVTGLPKVRVDLTQLVSGIGILRAAVLAGLVKSNGEARRMVASKGLRFNGEIVDSEDFVLGKEHFSNGHIVLSLGKKKHVCIELKR